MFKKLFLSSSENGPIIKEVLCEHLSEEETRTVEVLGERFGFRCFMYVLQLAAATAKSMCQAGQLTYSCARRPRMSTCPDTHRRDAGKEFWTSSRVGGIYRRSCHGADYGSQP